jgi:hypothetical protein
MRGGVRMATSLEALVERRKQLLAQLQDNTELLRAERAPEYSNTHVSYDGVVLQLVVRFTDGTCNVTEWTSGHDRMMYEASVRKMYGIKVLDISKRAHIKGRIDLMARYNAHKDASKTYEHMHKDTCACQADEKCGVCSPVRRVIHKNRIVGM